MANEKPLSQVAVAYLADLEEWADKGLSEADVMAKAARLFDSHHEAEVQRADEFKRIGQGFERDARKFFEQSCRNLERAEKAEAEVQKLKEENARLKGSIDFVNALNEKRLRDICAEPMCGEPAPPYCARHRGDWVTAAATVAEVERLTKERDDLIEEVDVTQESLEKQAGKVEVLEAGYARRKDELDAQYQEIKALRARVEELEGVLRKAAERFREYERLHTAKATPTRVVDPAAAILLNADAESRYMKAQANAAMATMCEAALSPSSAAEGRCTADWMDEHNDWQSCGNPLPCGEHSK